MSVRAGNDPAAVHFVADAPTVLHGSGPSMFERTSRDLRDVTCKLCLYVLDRPDGY
ncbi:hypothetical protein [Microbacterium sp. CBA3102]|uniref:hypothetical protein n=1 Tax=Microbacterium sp. CBA3102 TaxID=2603598 RepID=UPI0018843F69|nr:hypothetical protein [Microbacterium sp. CBA3102]